MKNNIFMRLALVGTAALLTHTAFSQTWQTVDDFGHNPGFPAFARTAVVDPQGNLLVVGQAKKHITSVVIKEKSVNASFESYDSTGCILTAVNIWAANDLQLDTGTPHQGTQQVIVSIAQLDICAGTPLLIADGIGTVDSLKIDPDLKHATLVATVPMGDDQFLVGFTSQVHLTFNSTGPLIQNHDFNIETTSPRMVIISKEHGDSRTAEAVGTVSVIAHPIYGTITNLVPLPSFEGAIQNTTWGTITIIK